MESCDKLVLCSNKSKCERTTVPYLARVCPDLDTAIQVILDRTGLNKQAFLITAMKNEVLRTRDELKEMGIPVEMSDEDAFISYHRIQAEVDTRMKLIEQVVQERANGGI